MMESTNQEYTIVNQSPVDMSKLQYVENLAETQCGETAKIEQGVNSYYTTKEKFGGKTASTKSNSKEDGCDFSENKYIQIGSGIFAQPSLNKSEVYRSNATNFTSLMSPMLLLHTNKVDGHEVYKINDDAQMALEELGGVPITVVSVMGPCGTGKTLLCNSLIDDFGFNRGFPTRQLGQSARSRGIRGSNTQGIWMAACRDSNNETYLILDVEGMGDPQETPEHDKKLCMLSMLLSGIVIYNTWGTLDNGTFKFLYEICSDTERICNENGPTMYVDLAAACGDSKNDVNNISGNQSNIFGASSVLTSFYKKKSDAPTMQVSPWSAPQLIIALRDVELRLFDKNGNYLTGSEYLDHALLPMSSLVDKFEVAKQLPNVNPWATSNDRIAEGCTDVVAKESKICLNSFFKKRECFLLSKPFAHNRETGKHIDRGMDLSKQFLSHVHSIRSTVTGMGKETSQQERRLTGSGLSKLLQTYVNSLNQHYLPDPHKWVMLQIEENKRIRQMSEQTFLTEVRNRFQTLLPIKAILLEEGLSECQQKCIDSYMSMAIGDIKCKSYHEKILRKRICRILHKSMVENQSYLIHGLDEQLNTISSNINIVGKIEREEYAGIDGVIKDIVKIRNKFKLLYESHSDYGVWPKWVDSYLDLLLSVFHTNCSKLKKTVDDADNNINQLQESNAMLEKQRDELTYSIGTFREKHTALKSALMQERSSYYDIANTKSKWKRLLCIGNKRRSKSPTMRSGDRMRCGRNNRAKKKRTALKKYSRKSLDKDTDLFDDQSSDSYNYHYNRY